MPPHTKANLEKQKERKGGRSVMVFPIPEEDQLKVIFSYVMNSRSDRVA